MTDKFKQECKKPAYQNRLGKIEYGNNQTISYSDNLQKIELEESCVVNNNIIGSIFAKTTKITTLDNYTLLDEPYYVKIGVKYADTSEEYINLGKYTSTHEINEKTTKNGQITGCDNLTLLNKKYECGIEDWTNKTISNVLDDVCTQTGLVRGTTTFTNDDIPVKGNLFQNNETCQDVLKAILNVTLSFAVVDVDNNKLYLKWVDDEVSDVFTKDDYSSLEVNDTYGPINCLIVKLPEVDGENATRQDDESIAQNGEHQFIINDDYFLNTQELRNTYIDPLWNKINGFTYVNYKLITYTGRPYERVGTKIKIENVDGTYFTSYVLIHKFTYDGTFESIFEAPSLSIEVEKIKNSKETLQNFKRRTEISVDKINGILNFITERVSNVEDNVTNNTYTKTQVNELIQNAESGLTNIFTQSGGNNLLRNTAPWYMKSENTAEFWNGNLKQTKEIDSTSGYAILIQNGTISQSVSLPTGTYSVSFKYKKLIDASEGYVRYNGKTFNLTETSGEIHSSGEITNNQFIIEINSNTNDSFEIYDLILKHGSEGLENMLVWTQNANESRSDTVQISEGITATSSVTDTKATMDSAGFIVRNKTTGTAVMEATKTGGKFLDLISTGKSNLSGLLVQKVGLKICINGESGS